jgi:hypothetical protein
VPGEELRPKKKLRPAVKHVGGVMVRGCVAAAGVGRFGFIEGGTNKRAYVDFLWVHLKRVNAEKLGFINSLRFTVTVTQNILHVWQLGDACIIAHK